MGDWSGGHFSVGLLMCLRETHMRPHLEEPLTPHTFIASPIRGEGGRKGEIQRGRERKGERRKGRDVFQKCSSIKSTDPNGIQ